MRPNNQPPTQPAVLTLPRYGLARLTDIDITEEEAERHHVLFYPDCHGYMADRGYEKVDRSLRLHTFFCARCLCIVGKLVKR